MANRGTARDQAERENAELEQFEPEETYRALTKAEILDQLTEAEARAAAAGPTGLIAATALYDPAAQRILLEFDGSRALVGVSRDIIPALAGATLEDLVEIEVYPSGKALRWPRLDVDVSVAAIVRDALGERALAGLFAAVGGRSTSAAKAEAARANGQKGGRPRSRTLVEAGSHEAAPRKLVQRLANKIVLKKHSAHPNSKTSGLHSAGLRTAKHRDAAVNTKVVTTIKNAGNVSTSSAKKAQQKV